MTWNLPIAGGSSTVRTALHGGGAAIALIVAAAFYRGVYKPLHDGIVDYQDRIVKVQDLTAVAPEVTREHQEMIDRFERLEAAAKATRNRMPRDPSANSFVDVATKLAKQASLHVDQFQTGLPQAYESYATIDVSCEVVGSYASVCKYLAAIDQLPQIARVLRLELHRSTDPARYPVQVTFQLYYQLDPHDKDQQREAL